MKKVLGLDLGTTSIGWAMVNQAENEGEKSSIIRAGVRVNPLSTEEIGSFEKGKAITTNADRTSKRIARRNIQRFKLRRDNLISILRREGWIKDNTILYEEGKNSTLDSYRLRAKAVTEEITLEELSRVLLTINKKRGFKSSRKAKNEDEGHLIDGMAIAKELYEKNITPAQLCLSLIDDNKKLLPDFYRSDLIHELELIWKKQSVFYPDILTNDFRKQLDNKSKTAVGKIFLGKYGIYTADNKGKDKKRQGYLWRVQALSEILEKEVMAYVIADVCGEINNSSGYLGAIGDRSKELFFQDKTIGQYLYDNFLKDPSFSLRNKVFYRQDYLDEFEKIWAKQASFHPQMTEELKLEIRDAVIFYQRRLKSQKGLINFCEFESRQVKVLVDGKEKTKQRGCRVAPRSSILFQEFKTWQILNNIEISSPEFTSRKLEPDEMASLAEELFVKDSLTSADALKLLFPGSKKKFRMNYKKLEGNRTVYAFYRVFLEIVDLTGHGAYDINKLSASEAREIISAVFSSQGFNTDILSFDTSLPKKQYEQQPLFKLWHLLYSYEGDKSKTGDESLIRKIGEICNTPSDLSRVIASITFDEDYASLSHKAMSKILPYLKEGNTYDVACAYAGYRHSKSSLTKDEIAAKQLVDKLPQLPKNSLRNPVVEKILNQMINVVNALSDEYGKPDEIHIEMARELKKNAKQREAASKAIDDNTKEAKRIEALLKEEFGLKYVRKSDIIRFKLYEELESNGFKTLYSNKYISREALFSRDIDIEHIIPQARLFDDSYSNKTLEFRDINIEKGSLTARDYVEQKYGKDGYEDYQLRVEDLFKNGKIGQAKRNKLLMRGEDIPEDFLNRDLSCSQYIAKVSKEILESYVRTVIPTTGSITKKLREDWRLVDVMKELNLPKYGKAGLTFRTYEEDGHYTERIEDWTKRNDHRHHAMDALTIAFTKPAHIQYLNNLAARSDKSSSIYGIEQKETIFTADRKRIFIPPMPLDELRAQFRENLESILVSIKAKNKVVTRNINRTKAKSGYKERIELTPRGALHKEQVYGRRTVYETEMVSVGGRLTSEIIETVASKREREALQHRLEEFGGDPKKAFTGKNSLDKNPIYLDNIHSKTIGAKVKCVRNKTVYSIRKNIDANLSVDKVMDTRARKLLQDRLAEFGGNAAKAFSNLDENPIWINAEKKIPLKRVTIAENFEELKAVRNKKGRDGHPILDVNGNPIPNDFVNLRNNHHIAIYEDADGNLQESVVSFFEALNRINAGRPVVDKEFNKSEGWKFLFTMKINEMFVFPNPENGFFPEKMNLMDPKNNQAISPNLFRVQKLASGDYWFRHHLETTLANVKELRDLTWKRILTANSMKGAVKIRINHIGQIVSVGEYD